MAEGRRPVTETLILVAAGLAAIAFLGVLGERVRAYRRWHDRRSGRELMLVATLAAAAVSGAIGTIQLLPAMTGALGLVFLVAWTFMAFAAVALAVGWAE